MRACLKRSIIPAGLFAGASLFLAGTMIGQPENLVPGQASDFSAVEYFPNSQQIHIRTSGSEGSQVGDTLYLVKNFKLEWFASDGHLQQVATAPECLIDQVKNTANSASHLVLQSGDGKTRVEGDGFLWRQTEQWLTISNHLFQVTDSSLAKTGMANKTAR